MMNTKQTKQFSFFLIIILIISGCMSEPIRVTKMQDQAGLAKGEVAILKGGNDIIILSIDGQKGKFTSIEYLPKDMLQSEGLYMPRGYKGFEIQLQPGHHQISVAIPIRLMGKSDAIPKQELAFEAKSGHTYLIKPNKKSIGGTKDGGKVFLIDKATIEDITEKK
jgi:hypothetical protein